MATSARSLRGFTLLELLVVIAIIAFLFSSLALTLAYFRKGAQVTATRGVISQVKTALIRYQVRHGSFPGTEGGAFAPNWPLPFDTHGVDFELTLLGDIGVGIPDAHLDPDRRHVLDAWRQRLRYRRSGDRVLVWSVGPDKIDQTGAQDRLKHTAAGDDLSSD